MKKFITYILLLISSVAISQEMVKAEIDTTNIRIGEQFIYKISVDGTENVIIPKLSLNGLEVVDTLKLDTIKNKLIKKYVLTGFDSGAFYIPQQQIFIRNQAYLTDSLLVNVATVAVDTTKIKKFAIKGIKSEPVQFDDYKHILFWILAILLTVAIILYFALKRTPSEEAISYKATLPPYQEALRGLKLLDEKLLWQNNKIKAYYSELTGIIRQYIEKELKVPALESTTNELIETLSDFNDSKTIEADTATIENLEKLLQQADLVKFAKSKPIAQEIESDRNIAEYIVNNLKPTITETTPDTIHIQPVVLVQKPTVKKPSVLVRIFIILILLIFIIMLSYALVKGISMSNSLIPQQNVY